ncbi:hypothetical protein V6N13_025748 [Hibiscus sabdariffa]|uniref:Uncharacterized protein n=1 Tax=Hibiscus sabdariffa TaxID=183260 RepID=A0ABR2CAG7_9ROSI
MLTMLCFWALGDNLSVEETFTADIASCSHVFASSLNKVAAIETSFPIEAVGCESGSIDIFSVELAIGNVDGNVESSSIDTISTELAVGNVVAGNVSNVFVNVELVAGVVKASIALSVGVPYVMPYQSIHALPVASTEVMELTKTAREVFKGLLI